MILIVIIFFLLFIYITYNSILESIPLVFGGAIYYLLLTIILFIFIYNLIKLFVNRKNGIFKIIVSLVISLILVVGMVISYDRVFDSFKGKGYLYTVNYKKVKNGLDNNFKDGYKVIGVRGKNVEVTEDTTCEYVYDVSLNDDTDIVFQAYYCPFGNMSISKSFSSNYDYYYLPYYLDLYNKNSNTNIRLEENDDIYSNHIIIYNNSNKEDVTKFLYYFDDNIIYKEYNILLKNEDNNHVSYVKNRDDFDDLR